MNKNMKYDVLVLGGGTAGNNAARAAMRAGAKKVAMINDEELGGLCILRGCMPTKAELASAHIVHAAKNADELGVKISGKIEPDFKKIIKRRDALVSRFQKAFINKINGEEYKVIRGRASFADDKKSVVVESKGKKVTLIAKKYVIATGSTPFIPSIEGVNDVPHITSDGVMTLKKQPKSMVVLGGGPIGLELSQFFARIGTKVTIISRTSLIESFGSDFSLEMERSLTSEENIILKTGSTIRKVSKSGSKILFHIDTRGKKSTLKADSFLIATGRKPNLDTLHLENIGLTPERGRLAYNKYMQTKNPNVYIAGDATGTHQILHYSGEEGKVAGRNAVLGKNKSVMDYEKFSMAVMFTDPAFAFTGLTEEEAKKKGISIVTGTIYFSKIGRGILMNTHYGLWKIVVDKKSGRIIGSQILGPRADDLIHLVATIIRYKGTVSQVRELTWYHPTLSEILQSLVNQVCSKLGDKEANKICPQ